MLTPVTTASTHSLGQAQAPRQLTAWPLAVISAWMNVCMAVWAGVLQHVCGNRGTALGSLFSPPPWLPGL